MRLPTSHPLALSTLSPPAAQLNTDGVRLFNIDHLSRREFVRFCVKKLKEKYGDCEVEPSVAAHGPL